MNILITGIHGFVGSNLVASLKEKHILYGLDIISPQTQGVASTFGWNELEQVPSVDLVIHLAGKAHDTKRDGETFRQAQQPEERGRGGDEEKKGEGARTTAREGTTESRGETRITY